MSEVWTVERVIATTRAAAVKGLNTSVGYLELIRTGRETEGRYAVGRVGMLTASQAAALLTMIDAETLPE